MIYLWLSRRAVEHLATVCQDDETRVELARHLRDADRFGEPAARSVLYSDDGDGLHFVAVTFHHDAHADRAWELLREDIDRYGRLREADTRLPLFAEGA